MASKKLLDMLHQAVARELQVTIQYMWQHVQVGGILGEVVKGEFKAIAITEMKHAEEIAERLNYYNEIPTTKPDPIFVGDTLEEMLKTDLKAEEEAMVLYKDIIKLAREENEHTIVQMFRKILADEEDHEDFFKSCLEDFGTLHKH